MLSNKRRPLIAMAMLLATALAVPAHAQFSDSYKFLEAVRKKEGDKVTEALNEPGTQIINTKDYTTGQTALHIVVTRRDLVWVQFLIAKGANVNARDNRGVTPLVAASEMGFLEGVDELIKSGARVDEANNTGETPLISAVHRKDLALVRMLIKAGASADRPDNSGRSARDYAALDKGSPVLGELEKASKEAKAAGPKKTYGPSF
ncbi:ankyrin repeat domain-containing protein [Novosphingobium taihuense]|uniref:Ankyrin repeat protein n=1 Tax=Novosphingobium taihuense TaxID=260085 RepID=A0A7W7ESQ9_9SPHN|nr:ankyrin repeat domain-containing protein [Novosphingobium taihuense]MBB4612061.1 ankyrin repeat protein [Novosphingobium taihuense]TWH88586.1 ankyrin repeat protein [Novosphingobium taihuense]